MHRRAPRDLARVCAKVPVAVGLNDRPTRCLYEATLGPNNIDLVICALAVWSSVVWDTLIIPVLRVL